MVVKLPPVLQMVDDGFESCVVLDGSQTSQQTIELPFEFESCVVLDGSQT